MWRMLSVNFTMTLISAVFLALPLLRLTESLSTRTSPLDYFLEDNSLGDGYAPISRALIETRSDGPAGKLNDNLDDSKVQSLFAECVGSFVKIKFKSRYDLLTFREATSRLRRSSEPTICYFTGYRSA